MNVVSQRYAAALCNLTTDEATLQKTAALLMKTPPLWEALTSPAIRASEKKAVLKRLPALQENEIFLHFYELLCDKGRIHLLPEMLDCYHTLALKAQGVAICVMTCVHPPEEAQRHQIEAMLCQRHHKREVRLEIRIDPALLGGFVLEIEGVTYDKSVLGQLATLAKRLQERRIV